MSRPGRPKSQPPSVVKVDLDEEAQQEANAASLAMSAAAVETADAAELHKMVGRIEAAHFIETISAKMIAETYVKARVLLGKMGEVTVRGKDGKAKRVSDMATFCELAMPVSARRCQQIVSSIDLLGETLYAQSEQIGFRARDYQSLKALPSDDQEVVKQALAEGTSREEVLELLSELAGRNQALRNQNAELEKTTVAKDRVMKGQAEKLTELAEQLARHDADAWKNPNEVEQQQLDTARDVGLQAEMALRRLSVEAGAILDNPATEPAQLAARQVFEFIARLYSDILAQHGVNVDFAALATPHWLSNVPNTKKPAGDA